MSWLFSRALVAEYSAGNCLDGEPFALSSGLHTQQAFCSPDKMTELSRLSRFGMMFKPLTDGPGEELLMSYLADFRAKTSVLQAVEQELTEIEVGCGCTWPASLAKYNPGTSSWKTAQLSLLGGLDEFSETWPRSGLMRNGECWERQTLGRLTSASGSGLWPTPTATQYKGWSKNHNRADTDDRLDYTVEREAHETGTPGRLNPMWVEWLMGWPLGWTDLKPLEMDRFLEWQKQHLPFSTAAKAA